LTTPAPGDLEILRAVYRHLDRDRLLAQTEGLNEEALTDFFRRMKARIAAENPEPAAAPSQAAEAAAEAGTMVLYCDGGSRGNPGPAGYGFVLLENGQPVAEGRGFAGSTTNNVAEYQGLIAGLEKAKSLGARAIMVRSDSELLVRQINGSYRVKNLRLKPLFERAQSLLRCFSSWRVEHVPREENRRADQLANEAMDQRA